MGGEFRNVLMHHQNMHVNATFLHDVLSMHLVDSTQFPNKKICGELDNRSILCSSV
jgi:hypothetical protein